MLIQEKTILQRNAKTIDCYRKLNCAAQPERKRYYIYLSDSCSGVSRSIKGISSLSYSVTHSGHFSYASSIITNGTVCINGQPSSNSAQHPKGSYCYTIHSSKAETDKNAKCNCKNRNDGGFISQSKAEYKRQASATSCTRLKIFEEVKTSKDQEFSSRKKRAGKARYL